MKFLAKIKSGGKVHQVHIEAENSQEASEKAKSFGKLKSLRMVV